MRGIQALEIEYILQFIYFGKATFYQERMNEFLDDGKSLGVKEISKDIEIPQVEKNDNFEEQENEHGNESQEVNSVQESTKAHAANKQRQLKSNDENEYLLQL